SRRYLLSPSSVRLHASPPAWAAQADNVVRFLLCSRPDHKKPTRLTDQRTDENRVRGRSAPPRVQDLPTSLCYPAPTRPAWRPHKVAIPSYLSPRQYAATPEGCKARWKS